jgi:hypothetical protein
LSTIRRHGLAEHQRQYAAEREGERKKQQRAREASGCFLRRANHSRPNETPEIADRIDQREPCRGSRSGESRA